MRRPEDDYIAIEVGAAAADRIEQLIAPNFTLQRHPDDLQPTDPEQPPIYFLALTDEGARAAAQLRPESF